MKEGPHGYKIIGGSEEEQKATVEGMQAQFNVDIPAIVAHTVEKTQEEIRAMHLVNKAVGEYIKSFDVEPRTFSDDQVILLEENSLDAIFPGTGVGGYLPEIDRVVVERTNHVFRTAYGLTHELLHAKSFKSVKPDMTSKKKFQAYRSGLAMRKEFPQVGKEAYYFEAFEEGIVAESTQRITKKLQKDFFTPEQLEAYNRFRELLDIYMDLNHVPNKEKEMIDREIIFMHVTPEDVIKMEYAGDSLMQKASSAMLYFNLHAEKDSMLNHRVEERLKMRHLLEDMVKKSNGELKDEEEVFDIFAKATFSGNYLPAARVVEKIYGKGSFRRIGQVTAEIR